MTGRILLCAAIAWSLANGVCAAAVPGPPRALTAPEGLVSPDSPAAKAVPLSELFGSANSAGAIWSDRSIIYNTVRAGEPNLWRQALAGGASEPITRFSGRTGGLRLSSDGQSVIFQGDTSGRELYDLYLVSVRRDAEPVNLTATDKVNETSPLPTPDGKQLAYAAREADKTSDNVVLMDLATRVTRQLTNEPVSGVHWIPAAFSKDGRTLIANRYDFSLTFSEAYRIDLATGKAVQLTPSGRYGFATAVTPDGGYAAVTIENAAGVRQAGIVDLKTGRQTLLAPSAWEQRTSVFSPDGGKLLFTTNEDGREQAFLFEMKTGKARKLPLPAGVNGQNGYLVALPAFSPNGDKILFPHSSGSTPLDYWTYDLTSRQARRVTRLSALGGWTLPRTQIVHYPAADGTTISAVLWMPYNLQRDGTARAVVIAHGGPTGQTMDVFDRVAAALSSRGYIVLAPNFRGSTGYGQAFMNANKLDLGGGDLQDLVAGAEFLKRTGYVDAKRIGVTGGSYGGYMTLMSLAKTPGVFAAGVDMFGIVNWRTMWERGAPQNRRYQAGLLGEPETQPGVYDRSSPLTYLDQLRAPLLVLQGENDPRVPPQESRQVVDFLKAKGRVVEAHFYPGEGHGFVKPENQRDALQSTIDWFDRYLK